MLHYWDLIMANRQNIYEGILLLMAIATFIVRLTPTKVDDGFLARVDKYVQKFLDWVRIPNRLK